MAYMYIFGNRGGEIDCKKQTEAEEKGMWESITSRMISSEILIGVLNIIYRLSNRVASHRLSKPRKQTHII